MKKDGLYDVTIIGGGPVGLFSAFYSGMREMKTKLIESGPELGGKVSMFFPEKTIRDIGGIPAITGADLVERLKEQAQTFAPTIICGQRISGLERLEDGTFLLTSTQGDIHHTRTIILTVGHGIFEPIKLDIEGAERYESGNLHYSVGELDKFKGKHVLISGGGNAAVDWANELLLIAKKVTVIHRRDEFRGHEQHVTHMSEAAVTLTPYALKTLHGESDRIQKVKIEHLETGETRELEIDELIVNHGIRGDLGGINDWGLEMKDGHFVVNNAMETNIPGIFAAGDAVTYPNKLKLITGGFTEGPVAVNSAKKHLQPESPLADLYSTYHDKFVDAG
jgi:ferredoxin/flavodoxin---NADP+ reductase